MPPTDPPYRSLVLPVSPPAKPDRSLSIALRIADPGGADVYLLCDVAGREAHEHRAYLNDLRMAHRYCLGTRSQIRLHVAASPDLDLSRGILAFARSVAAGAVVLAGLADGPTLDLVALGDAPFRLIWS